MPEAETPGFSPGSGFIPVSCYPFDYFGRVLRFCKEVNEVGLGLCPKTYVFSSYTDVK